MGEWEILSGQIVDKQGQIKYHVKCTNCRTVRILTKQEMEADKCGCWEGDD